MLRFYVFRSKKMAGSAQEVFDKAFSSSKNEKSSSVECAVCLQTCIHPAELPCGHIFCYLCIKGIVNQGRRCAMCRRDIPVDYLEKPRLLNPLDAEITNQGYEDGHLWFYEGHNGWWQYDERTSLELESAYQKGERCCELLIAGFLYVADFDEMLQYRRSDPNKRRRIKRDLATTNKKGVAGLKTTLSNSTSLNSTSGGSNENNHIGSTSNATETAISSPVRNLVLPNSNEFTDSIFNLQRSSQRILLGLPPSTCPSLVLGNPSSITNNPAAHFRNSNFENVIHETLDWTIEQIESLNLELLNDYEVLSRDANNYEQLESSLNQNRSERRINNYLSQYLSRNSPLRESMENESERTCRVTDSSELNYENNGSEPPSVPTQDTFTTSEIEFDNFVMPSGAESPPQPPPRGTSRRNFLRRSLSLNHEMYTSKFS